jgi:hypothetical protein
MMLLTSRPLPTPSDWMVAMVLRLL